MKKVVIGIDVSKKKLDVSVIVSPNESCFGIPTYCGEFPNTNGGCTKIVNEVKKMAKGIPQEEWLFCVETTGGYSRCVCDTMHKKGLCIWRESALQIKWSKGVIREKNDKADSKMIADYAMRNQDKCVPYVPDSPEVCNLKALFRYRMSLVKERRSKILRMKELKDTMPDCEQKKFMIKDMGNAIDYLTKSIKECQKKIMEIIDKDRDLKVSYTHITSIKGIGMLNAVAFIIHTNNFTTSKDARKFGCYCGVAPFRSQSGTSINHSVKVNHLSNIQMKALLTCAAVSAARTNPEIRSYYQRLIKSGKCQGIAMNNVKNKLLRIMFSLIENNCDYEEEHEKKRSKMAS